MECTQLIELFEREFSQAWNIRLFGGAEEPVYLPADQKHPNNRLFFTRDYLSSALHEISHWCIAGKQRLQQEDWGYWYVPDGRNIEQQRAFETVEVKVQALEWALSLACQQRFRVSTDNLNGETCDDTPFKDQVYQQALEYCHNGLPERGERFYRALLQATGQYIEPLAETQFDRQMLD